MMKRSIYELRILYESTNGESRLQGASQEINRKRKTALGLLIQNPSDNILLLNKALLFVTRIEGIIAVIAHNKTISLGNFKRSHVIHVPPVLFSGTKDRCMHFSFRSHEQDGMDLLFHSFCFSD